ncbi:MAG TPA: tail fiber domain-containing protein [Pyrinomonadaceae bacterium]
MTIAKHSALALALTFFVLHAGVQAQTAQMTTVNITAQSNQVHITTEGDVSEFRVDVADEQGDVVFQSGQFTGQSLDWKMTDAQGERVAPGTYTVTVTFRMASGKLRKRVEQIVVEAAEKPTKQSTAAPNAVQATITGAGTNGKIAKFTGAATIGNSVITESAGKIGIGTAAPASLLTVAGATANSPALLSSSSGAGGIAVKGTSLHASGIGVAGLHRETTGTAPAVKGETNSRDANAVAVLGVVNPSTAGDQSAAVKGINNDTSLLGCGICGFAVGVWGEQAANGFGVYGMAPNGVGVYGTSSSGTGVYAQSSSGPGVSGNSGSGDGVAGTTTSGRAVSGITGGGTGIYGMSSTGEAGHFDGKVFIGGPLTVASGGCMGCNQPSDRNLKANFSSVNPRTILDRLASIPIQTWRYKSEPESVRHIGAMAQDFRSAFGFGESDQTLNTVDAQGVTMAAIQGLYQQNQELKSEVQQLRAQVTQLQRTVKQRRTVGRGTRGRK